MVKKLVLFMGFLTCCSTFVSNVEAMRGKKREKKEVIENSEQRKKACIASLIKKQKAAEIKEWRRLREAELLPVKKNLFSEFENEDSGTSAQHVENLVPNAPFVDTPTTPVFNHLEKKKKRKLESPDSTI